MAITQGDRLLNLMVESLDQDFLLIQEINANEGLSQLFEFELDLLHIETKEGNKPTPVDPHDVLGQPMTVAVNQPNGTQRYFNGICCRFTQGQRDQWFTHYQATLVPDVWTLTQIARSRIFQNISVDKILKKVFDGFEVDYEIGTFEPRNYCVQYRETDWDFACRLMEEEGIYYYFEHTENSHRMILGNTPDSHRECPSKSKLPFYMNEAELGTEWGGVVLGWYVDNNLRTGKYELWDYNFQLPTSKLDALQLSRFNIGGNQDLENYDFPGGYAKRFDAIDSGRAEHQNVLQKVFDDRKRTVKIRQEEQDAGYKTIRSASDCCSLTAGYRFKLSQHPIAEDNIFHVIITASHHAIQSPSYVAHELVPKAYSVQFTCIPHGGSKSAPFRPPRKTPRPIVHGTHSAVVSGPAGEEIYTDKYGRVKVQFPWDRDLKFDAESSAWLRVATSIAGKKWGTMYIPRIGQEVLVAFMEGDPDQPIIVGEVYNPETMPHYELPKYSTLTYIKTRTSPDDGKGYNELRFEDKANKEQVFIRSQKRMDVRVRGSLYETCGGSRNEVIGYKQENQPGGNLVVTVAGEYDLHVKEDTYIGIDGKLIEGVKGDVAEEYKGKQFTKVSAAAELNAQNITLEALQSITLKVGASFVLVDLMGVTISGPMVKINSGGSAQGTSPAQFADPTDAEQSDTGEPGYLDKPRKGGGSGGGGHRWRTIDGYHAPTVTYDPGSGNYKVGKNIVVKGTDDFKKKALNDIASIGSTPTGKKLLDNIDGGKHTVTVQESPINPATGKRSTGFATKTNPADAENGTGTDTTISYNTDGTKAKDKDGKPIDIPGKEVLGHELIHADHNSSGTNLSSQPDPKDPTGNQEESRTIGINDHKDEPISENKLLEEQGADYRRTDHDGGFVRVKK
jgi:type VI secretion system secreted protein VgrG